MRARHNLFMPTRLSYRVLSNATVDQMGTVNFLTVVSFDNAQAAQAYRASVEGPSQLTVVRKRYV